MNAQYDFHLVGVLQLNVNLLRDVILPEKFRPIFSNF